MAEKDWGTEQGEGREKDEDNRSSAELHANGHHVRYEAKGDARAFEGEGYAGVFHWRPGRRGMHRTGARRRMNTSRTGLIVGIVGVLVVVIGIVIPAIIALVLLVL